MNITFKHGSNDILFDELFDNQDLVVGVALALDDERVAFAILALQMLHAAETLELAVDHDAETTRERLALLHAVGGQHDGHAKVACLLDHRPQVAARRRIHAGRRLVEKDDERTAEKGDARAHLALVAAAQLLHKLVVELVELEDLDELVDALGHRRALEAAQAGDQVERVAHRQVLGQHVELRTEAEVAARLGLVVANVVAVDERVATRRLYFANKHLERGRFAGAVQTEQTERTRTHNSTCCSTINVQ